MKYFMSFTKRDFYLLRMRFNKKKNKKKKTTDMDTLYKIYNMLNRRFNFFLNKLIKFFNKIEEIFF